LKKLIILLFTVFLSVGSLSAQSTDLKKLEQQASQGNAIAQYNLGVMYYNGEGVPQDYAQAMKWLRLAADQGLVEAQYNLGVMYENGQGVPQDDAQAMKWYRLAADQGYAEARYNLGVMYDKGQGVTQDYAQAMKWYRLAADQGVAKAQYNLGVMYYFGRGVPQDYAQAMKWYRLAADQGLVEAQFNLGVMYDKGQGVTQDDAQAMKWYRLAADQGEAKAVYNLKRLPEKKMLSIFSNRWWRPFSLSEVPSLLIPLLLPFPLFFFKKTRKKLIDWAAGLSGLTKIVTILAALNICYALAGWIGLIVTLVMMFLSLWGPVGSALALCVYHQQWAPASHLIAYSLFSSLCFWVSVGLSIKLGRADTNNATKA